MTTFGGNRADLWLGNRAPLAQAGNTELRGMDTSRLIDDRPSVIVITRRDPATGVAYQLDPQTVRIEVQQNSQNARELRDVVVAVSDQYVVVIGNKDNPTIPDTDLLRNDLFFYQSRMYVVLDFIDTVPGRLLASCKLNP